MKIKTEKSTYREVMARERNERKKPVRPNILFRSLIYILSQPSMRKTHFSVRKKGMEKLGKKEPCLVLMNHSSFIDLKIASTLLYPRPFNMGVFISCWKRNPSSLQISEGLRIIFDYRFQLEAIIHFPTLGTGFKAFL